jgi:hypothetical protein
MSMKAFTLSTLPLLPAWLIVLLIVALLALLAYGSRLLHAKQVPARWVKILGGMRLLIIVVFALCLLQPVASFTRSVEPAPELLVLVDTSQSMGLAASSGRKSRLEETLGAFQRSGLPAALRRQFAPRWFAFDRSAYPVVYEDLTGLRPTGDTTRFAESLTTAWNYLRSARSANAGPAPARLILLSDGNDRGSQDFVATARKFGLAIDTLAPPDPDAAPATAEPAIIDVQCARRVLLGSETQFLVTIRHDDSGEHALTLSLTEDGKEAASQDVVVGPAPGEKRVHVAHRPTTIGMKLYEFRLAGKGADAPRSDAYRLSVQVVDNRTEVLILEDSWRWEFKFLRRIFENDPSFTFTALLSRGGAAFAQFGEPDRRVQLGGFPQSRAELNWFDAIILGDVNPKRWPRGLAASLAQVVTEEGKSLIVIAGPNLAQWAETADLQGILPVEITREAGKPVEGPVEVRLTPEGSASSFFFNPDKKAGLWSSLPPLDQIYPPLRKRPAATVLVEAARRANAHGNLIVMAEHTVGRGRVLFVGTDTLWKWQTLAPANEAGVTPYAVFWLQALRALAPARLGSGGASLWLTADRSRYEAGQKVILRAEVQSERPLAQPKVQATVVLPGEKRLPLALGPDPANPQVFQAEFETSAPGSYRIAAVVTSEGKTAADTATAIDVEESKGELADVRVDANNLARIAAATGGRRIDLADPATWPTSSDVPRVAVRQTQTLDLWNNFSLPLLLCGLLGVDWLLRLLRGYV